ncbi:MAG: hypothetical protein WCO84_04130 [bacterium]
MKKVIGIIVVILLFVFASITALGIYWPQIREYKYSLEAKIYQERLDNERKELEDAQKADTFGGKTPEETFDMFLDALKKKDIELASKYYNVKVQKKALEGLKKELAEKGNLDMSITYFTDVGGGVKGCNKEGNGCTFEYEYTTIKDETIKDDFGNKIFVPKGEVRNKSIDFNLNSFNQNWKIN